MVVLTDINLGAAPDDDTGDTLRASFQKINANNALIEAHTHEEVFTSDVETVADQDYVLWYDAPFPGTITMIRTESASGTCTLTGKVNTTALGGTANSVSSTAQEQAHSTANTFVKGDKVLYTVSSNASCLNMAVAFYLTRTG